MTIFMMYTVREVFMDITKKDFEKLKNKLLTLFKKNE
jgi:hypothetical protein